MVKKGKKKQHAQAAAASTSSTDPIPSTSRQHPSQQTPPPQQQKKQKKKQEPQQQSQQELQQSQKELQKSQQKSQQQQQPQQQRPQQQQPQQQQPQQQQPQQQQPQQQQPQQQQPQQQQPQQQQLQQQQPQQQQPQQQQSQLESKPRAWRPSRMQHPPPFQQRQPQVTQIQEWSAQQFPTPQQVSDPHMQQFTSQSVPAWGLPCGQLPPQQRVTQQQAIRAQYPQQQVPQQTHMQPAWSRPPVPHPQQPLGWMPLPPTQQFMPQQTFQQQTRVVPPQQSTPQVMQQQPAWVSYPSTSTQQVLGIGDSGAQTGRTTGKDERTEKSDTSRMVPPMTSASSELARGMSQLMLEKKDKRMSEKDLNIPKRRNPYKAGTVGTPIRVKTNMFEIIFRDDFVTTAVHYDIKVVPIDNAKFKKDDSRPKREIKNKTLLRKIFEKWRVENYPDRYPAYDGMANVFAAREFPFIDTWFGEVNIHDDERDENRSFEITINKAGTVDLSWMKTMRPGLPEMDMTRTAVQILDIILRHAPASRLISVGKSLFPAGENRRVKALGSGLDLHVGGFLSAVIGWKPYLNIDVAHKAFVASENVVDIICDILQMKTREDLNSRNARDAVTHYEDKINKVLTGVKVNYAIPNQPSTKRTHRINGLGPDAINHKFDVKGKMCSIQEYFATVKNCKLNFPHLPCLWVGKRDGKTYLPAELCKVAPGQAVNRKLDESQTTQMIKYAATKTDDRIEKIRRAFNGICVNDSHVMQNEFHLQVAAQMKEVDARILIPPALQYNDRAPALVSKGVWRAKRFSKPAKLEDGTWTIANVCYKNIDRNLPDFVDVLRNQASYFGMTVGKAQLPYPTVKPVPHEIERFFSNMRDLKLIIVILPDRTDAVYGTVKKISELRVGVLTQCIKMKNVLYPNNSTISNILLKINSKLNGINHTFTQNTMPYCLRGKNYMLIGADVSHPSPDAKDIPSVAAVAASHDETTFKYNVTIRLQQPKQEEISDLKEIMIKHIQFYVKEMKMPPQIIIFYRDGVSEGQIAMVLDKEIRSIKDACREYARERPGFNPQLTFVIVQKRHHVRLFPTRDQDSDDRNRNVKAGTIVDTEITHPNHIDFYLVSHASIQGTARPTKYRCICNESNFTEDQLEELTYHLCHMYARCTRSVSYPAPTYYAHLAAYRGRMWIQGDRYTEMDFQDKNKCKLEPLLKMPMSFI